MDKISITISNYCKPLTISILYQIRNFTHILTENLYFHCQLCCKGKDIFYNICIKAKLRIDTFKLQVI